MASLVTASSAVPFSQHDVRVMVTTLVQHLG